MDRADLLAFLAEEITAREQAGLPLKVGIDGRCGAGKSMLADELGRSIGGQGFDVVRLSVDDFHHPQERRYRQGEYSAQGYYEDAFDYEAIASTMRRPQPSNTILLFEGIFVFRGQLNNYWGYRILIDIDAETSFTRSLLRDTGVIGPADLVRRKMEERYEPAWQIYVREENPEVKADVVIDNRAAASPRILKGGR